MSVVDQNIAVVHQCVTVVLHVRSYGISQDSGRRNEANNHVYLVWFHLCIPTPCNSYGYTRRFKITFSINGRTSVYSGLLKEYISHRQCK